MVHMGCCLFMMSQIKVWVLCCVCSVLFSCFAFCCCLLFVVVHTVFWLFCSCCALSSVLFVVFVLVFVCQACLCLCVEETNKNTTNKQTQKPLTICLVGWPKSINLLENACVDSLLVRSVLFVLLCLFVVCFVFAFVALFG